MNSYVLSAFYRRDKKMRDEAIEVTFVLVKLSVAYLTLCLAVWGFSALFEKFMIMILKSRLGERSQWYHDNPQNPRMSVGKACKILGIKKNDLKNMSKSDLKKVYWKKAQEVHPDHKGGDGDLFKDLGDAFSYMKACNYA